MSTTTARRTLKLRTVRPKIIYFAVGLFAGPLITSVAGWQVLSGTARDRTHAGIVELQAAICAARARTEVADTAKMQWPARTELAKRWAVMPGATEAGPGVADACARKLTS